MLRVKKLAKTFGTRILFKNVEFEILPQSIHILQGANGAGKSTLFKILLGFIEQDAGEIESELNINEIGYVGHATFQYPELSALENLRFWHNLHTKKELATKDYLALLEEVGLARFANEPTRIFSRGMAQKLNIARLLLQKPKLYLLDEPSTGLDVQARAFLVNHILKAKEDGAAVFWISHDIEKDKAYADYLHSLEHQKLTTLALSKNSFGGNNA